MAAHLNGLHISTDYTTHSAAESMDVMMDSRDAEAFGEKVKGHTIVLSEEVKRIKEEPILPAVLIERYLVNSLCNFSTPGYDDDHYKNTGI